MAKLKRQAWTTADYERSAAAYYRRLPLEHFMEAIPAATQRKISLESFDLLSRHRPQVQCFNELLVQYWFHGRLRQVVPDNMVREWDRPPVMETNFSVDMEPVGPLLVMEYVSPASYRKDYKQSFLRYETELRVPYYLLFYPERQDLRLYRLQATAYQQLTPNALGRLELPELEVEVALLDRWVRYWYRGELLLLPADLQDQVDQFRQQLDQSRQEIERQQRRADHAQQRLDTAETELAQLRAQLAQLRGEPGKPKTRKKNGG